MSFRQESLEKGIMSKVKREVEKKIGNMGDSESCGHNKERKQTCTDKTRIQERSR